MNFLQKILGGVSTYYEMLMESKKETVHFTDTDVDFIATQLQGISLNAHYVANDALSEVTKKSIIPKTKVVDTGKVPFICSFKVNGVFYSLFCDPDKALKKDQFHALIESDQIKSDREMILLPNETTLNGLSLSIWEELAHRNTDLNDMVKKRAPKNPWTLYKKAKAKAIDTIHYKLQIGGYPQWLVNDIDYRKIKKLEFLCEFKLNESNSLYYFKDNDLNEIVFFKQKL